MEPFATIEDLEARWRTLTEDEQEQAGTTLLDATAFITAEMRRYHVPINEDDEVQHQNLVAVTCAVAKRSLLMAFDSGNTLTGVSKYSEQADVWNASVTLANPMGDMYLTAQEKRLLGIGRVLVRTALVAMKDMRGCDVEHGPTAGIWTP